MYGRIKSWGMVAGLMCSTAATSFATEPFVQDFDGWKITIRPGVSSMADVPPAPRPLAVPTADRSTGRIQLISLQQEITPPVPQPDGPPAINSTPQPVVRPQLHPQPQPDGDVLDGFPRIIPGESDCCTGKTTVNPPEGTVDPRYMAQMYSEIYKSIPFIRAEYDGNPTYIHDTTVEFLFGKMRPTVIHREQNSYHHRWGGYGGYGGYGYGVPFAYGGAGFGLNGYGWNGGAGYAYPPLQLVVPGTGLRIHRLN